MMSAMLTALIIGVPPIAVIVNYPRPDQQRDRIASHADSVVAVVFGAAVRTGVLSGTGMIEQMAHHLLTALPGSPFPFFSIIGAVLSVRLRILHEHDAYYFGAMPILAEAGAQRGIGAMEIARASLLGQPIHMLSRLVPAMYVLNGLAKADVGDHHRFAIKWALLVCTVIIGSEFGLGVTSIR